MLVDVRVQEASDSRIMGGKESNEGEVRAHNMKASVRGTTEDSKEKKNMERKGKKFKRKHREENTCSQDPIGSVVGKRGADDMEVDDTTTTKKGRVEGKADDKEQQNETTHEAGLPEQSCEAQ